MGSTLDEAASVGIRVLCKIQDLPVPRVDVAAFERSLQGVLKTNVIV